MVAFCSLTINQDLGHDAVVEALAEIPELIEIHTVSGSSDLMARIAGMSLESRYAGWRREPFTHLSASHVSVYLKALSSTA